jgi:protein ImuA
MTSEKRAAVFEKLQTDILRLQGFKASADTHIDTGLGPILDAFPNRCFPLGAVHEFLSPKPENMAATTGFVMGLLSPLMNNSGASVWIRRESNIFPPGVRHFGIEPDRVIFLDLHKEKDILWTMEEALKCGALTAVVGELPDLNFTDSRRLQLAVEKSKVTGFAVRSNIVKVGPTACVSRWRISPLPALPVDDLPGIGYPQWKVELLRVRNGKNGVWNVGWKNGAFSHVKSDASLGHPSPSREALDSGENPSHISSLPARSRKHRKAG